MREGKYEHHCCDDAEKKIIPFLFCRRCRHHGGLLRIKNERMKIARNGEKCEPCEPKKKIKNWGKSGGDDPKL